MLPRPILQAMILALCVGTAQATPRPVLHLGFDGPAGADGLPSPWAFERWSPMVGFGDYTARASVITPSSGAGAPAGPVLQVECDEAGFLVGSERSIDPAAHHIASWSWRADTVPTGASFRARETNDQVLQLLFGFEGGKILGYIWDSTGTPGASGSGLSWREDVRVMVLQAGLVAPGGWVHEQRNISADFQTLFGEAPGRLVGVAVQSNCQHTESSGHGYIGPITLAGS